MAHPFYHDHPQALAVEATVLAARPGAVRLDRSPFFPGGGGQLADRGTLAWGGGRHAVTGFAAEADGSLWHLLDAADAVPEGAVRLEVDGGFRHGQCEVHTLAHILNSLLYREFNGALLTGVQLGADGSFRLDADLPGADNDRLRALAGPINDVIRMDLPVRTDWMDYEAAAATPGLFRSKSVAPPPGADGTVRLVEIGDIDRQACGGTHLASTGQSRPVQILKVESKGRQNRRIRVGIVAA